MLLLVEASIEALKRDGKHALTDCCFWLRISMTVYSARKVCQIEDRNSLSASKDEIICLCNSETLKGDQSKEEVPQKTVSRGEKEEADVGH